MKNNAKFRFTLAFANIFVFVSGLFLFLFCFTLIFYFQPASSARVSQSSTISSPPLSADSTQGEIPAVRDTPCQAARFVPAGQGASSASPSGGVTVPTTVSGMATSTAPKVIIIIIIIIVLIIITRYSHGLN